MNESMKKELDQLKTEFRFIKSNLTDLKNENFQTLQLINNKVNRTVIRPIFVTKKLVLV